VTGVINFMRALTSALMVALYGAFLFGAGPHGMTLEALAAPAKCRGARGHFRWIFAAARCASRFRGCSCCDEERPLRRVWRRGRGRVPAE